MAKKFVRGITDIKTINNQDFDTNNVNDLLSDGEHNYIHRKKGKVDEYHNLTDNLKTVTSDNTDLLTVTNDNDTSNSATLHPKHDSQKEQTIESTRNTITIEHGENASSESTKVDTNAEIVLEHDNLLVGNGLSKQKSQNGEQTTLRVSDNVMNIINNTIKSLGNITSYIKDEPFNDLNTLPRNTIVTYSGKDNVQHCPKIAKSGFTIITFSGTTTSVLGGIQILYTPEGQSAYRVNWIYNGTQQWSEWIVNVKEEINKYPLALELFENIAVIGDSYSSGELIPAGSGVDYYNISWIQLLARKHGLKATNYSRGGLQTRTWLTSEYGLQKMEQDTAKDLYFIYLGINDNNVLTDNEIGSVSDIGTENDTFYGNYGKIINHVITKAPHAKIAIINMHNGSANRLYTHINTIADHFNLPILDLSKNPLTSSSDFVAEMKAGHPQALGYATLAGAIEQLLKQSFNNDKTCWIDYIPQTVE